MKRLFRDHRALHSRLVIGLFLALCLVLSEKGWAAESPGLEFSLYTERNQYDLGDLIELVMVLKNEAGELVVTDEGFSKEELHRYLKITDPAGTTHFSGADPTVHGMPAPFFWQDNAWAQAETLPEDFVLSAKIVDLKVLLPLMEVMTGWYTIQGQISFVRYENSETRIHSQLGTLGQVDSQNNWEGTIESNQIQVFISPGLGAELQIQVLDQNGAPLPQVPVRVFKTSETKEMALGKVWAEVEPVLSGITDFDEGLVKQWQGAPCRPMDDYTAIGYYQGGYEKAGLKTEDDGWALECSGIISKKIVFGESAMPTLSTFSAFAQNSIWIKAGAVISSGHIGVMDASAGLWLDSGVEVSIGLNARLNNGVRIYGDSVKLWSGASVDDVYHNDIQSSGTIRGEAVTPLALPLPVQLPEFPEITAGTQNITVGIGRTTTLNPGRYRDVSVRLLGTLRLKEGVYHFRNLNIGAGSQLVCLGPGPTEIRIKQRLHPGMRAKIGPSAESGLTARDVVFYVEGTNGNLWDLFSYPRAAEIGSKNVVRASIYVPNGTLAIDADSRATGAFVGRGVVVGIGTRVELESGF